MKLILILIFFFTPFIAYSQIDGGGDLDVNNDILFFEEEQMLLLEISTPCYCPQNILVGMMTIKMPGMSWLGQKINGDSCEVDVSFHIEDCGVPVLVIDSVFIKPCCNPDECRPSFLHLPNIPKKQMFNVQDIWFDVLIGTLIEKNAGQIVQKGAMHPKKTFLVKTNNCYQGKTIDPLGTMSLGARIISCSPECCIITFNTAIDLAFDCAYHVTAYRETNDDQYQCPIGANNLFCTNVCHRSQLYGMQGGKFVVTN